MACRDVCGYGFKPWRGKRQGEVCGEVSAGRKAHSAGKISKLRDSLIAELRVGLHERRAGGGVNGKMPGNPAKQPQAVCMAQFAFTSGNSPATQNLQNQLSINHCLESIALKGHEHKKLLDAGFLAMREALEKNKEQLQKWEDTYLLKAPTAGRVQLAHAWEAQQKVTPQQAAITILPEKQRSCVVKISCAAKDAAKVSAGQRVLLEVQGFPAFTHGYLEGRVQHVSEVPTGGRYAVEALLVQGFITTLGKEVHFNRYAEGHGKVITSNQPFIARLLKNTGFLE